MKLSLAQLSSACFFFKPSLSTYYTTKRWGWQGYLDFGYWDKVMYPTPNRYLPATNGNEYIQRKNVLQLRSLYFKFNSLRWTRKGKCNCKRYFQFKYVFVNLRSYIYNTWIIYFYKFRFINILRYTKHLIPNSLKWYGHGLSIALQGSQSTGEVS